MKKALFSVLIVSTQIHRWAGAQPAHDFVAHEWGTFTSVQAADGVQLEWNPLITTELPGFVYDPAKPSGDPRRHISLLGPKTAFRTLQRMETPVIYFYSSKERTVDVAVKFPKGLITEWFPQAHEIGPSFFQPRPALAKLDNLIDQTGVQPGFKFSSLDTSKSISDSLIRWTKVKIIPANEQPKKSDLLAVDSSGSHYYAARDTGSDLLRVDGSVQGTNKTEYEKFLFYRGIGNFQTPLQVTMGSSEDYVQLHNFGAQDLTDLFVFQLHHGQGKYLFVERLGPGEDATVKLEPNKRQTSGSELAAQIQARMEESLSAQGLYPAEAKAMVQTWKDSWFAEEGLRVLYVLPRQGTEQILPLSINPQPSELVRVMVGRAEVITPQMEWQLLKQIVKFSEADEASRPRVIEETRSLSLGRFAEPTVRRVLGKTPGREFSQQAWDLLEATKPPPHGGKNLATK